MAKLEAMIKEAIAREARRQVRSVVTPVRRELLRLRKKVADLHTRVTTLRRSANGWKRIMQAAPVVPQVSEEDAKAARLSPRLIQSLRKRLGLSQTALARPDDQKSERRVHQVGTGRTGVPERDQVIRAAIYACKSTAQNIADEESR